MSFLTPRQCVSPPGRENPISPLTVRNDTCLECGAELHWRERPKSEFCSDAHSRRYRDRLRYQADPEAQRAKSRAYYAKNRERVLERVKAKKRRGRRVPKPTD